MSGVVVDNTKSMEAKIQEWIEADKEGRLVILPFAPGTTLYQIMPKCGGGQVCPYNGGCGLERCGKYVSEAKCGPYVKDVTYNKPIDIDVSKYYTSKKDAEEVLKHVGEAESVIARARELGYV